MDYRASAKDVLDAIGGRENIISAAHCATRLRLVIADNKRCNREQIEEVDGVKGVFEASGQLQVIFGTGIVNKIYEEFIALAGISAGTKEDVKQAAANKQNIFQRAIKTLGDIFVPIIPAIVASGLLMGLLEGFCNLWPQMAASSTYTIFHLFSNAAFTFLPILIAVSAAKAFGGNQFLGAVIGMIMIHPDLLNAWSIAGMDVADIPSASVWFGLYDINMVGYQGHVIPVVIAVWIMSILEKRLHQIVPEIIDLFVTPLVTVLVTGYLTLTMIGPVFSTVENWVLAGARNLIAIPFGVGAAIVGGLYAPTVVAGVHHMYNALEAGLLSATNLNTWMPIATAANVAQGAACLALAMKTKSAKTRAIALPASLSAYLGITEPAIFGVNIRYMKPFVAGCIGGICGGLVAGITGIGASAYGITGVFGFLITTEYVWQYTLMLVVSTVVAFVISWMLYQEEPLREPAKRDEEKPEKGISSEGNTELEVCVPIEGQAIPLSEVNDATFAEGILGKGAAIVPETGRVVAPFHGIVSTVFPTRHAIGLTGKNGVEVLIHIGINTVELEGKFYSVYIEAEEEVRAGDLLAEFDIEGIKAAGYDITTPVIVTNSNDYESVDLLKQGNVKPIEGLLSIR